MPTLLDAADRPRERLRAQGVRALAARELVALLVGAGGASGSASVVAERILGSSAGSLRRLAALDPASLERVPGVGAATAARVLAALELGRRAAAEPPGTRERIQGPGDVHLRIGPRLRDLPQEEFHALLLDSRHCVLREVLVTRGTIDASLISPREVFRLAVVGGGRRSSSCTTIPRATPPPLRTTGWSPARSPRRGAPSGSRCSTT